MYHQEILNRDVYATSPINPVFPASPLIPIADDSYEKIPHGSIWDPQMPATPVRTTDNDDDDFQTLVEPEPSSKKRKEKTKNKPETFCTNCGEANYICVDLYSDLLVVPQKGKFSFRMKKPYCATCVRENGFFITDAERQLMRKHQVEAEAQTFVIFKSLLHNSTYIPVKFTEVVGCDNARFLWKELVHLGKESKEFTHLRCWPKVEFDSLPKTSKSPF